MRFIEEGKITPQEQVTDSACGPACVRMTLEYFGELWSQDYLIKALGTNKSGTALADIERFLWYKGYSTQEYAGISYERLKRLREENPEPLWLIKQEDNDSHYVLVKEVRETEIDLYDSGNGGIETLDRVRFMHEWRDSDIHWCMVVRKLGR